MRIGLLLRGEDPAKILCITFTKAAAANMTRRVFDTLAAWTSLDDPALEAAMRSAGAKDTGDTARAQARRLFAQALETPGGLKVQAPFTGNLLPKVEAAPWPYVPADLLPIFIALGVRAQGQVLFWNKVYDGALHWTGELARFDAMTFSSDPHRIVTFGGRPLRPAVVDSPYIIRVAIALLMVAASIPGRSVIRQARCISPSGSVSYRLRTRYRPSTSNSGWSRTGPLLSFSSTPVSKTL